MTIRDIISRAVATFVQAFTAELLVFSLLDAEIAVWLQALAAGGGAVVALAHRIASSWLEKHPETGVSRAAETIRIRPQPPGRATPR